MKVWQIAAGDRWRDYSHLFLKHDVAFLGPGRAGEFSREAYKRSMAERDCTSSEFSRIQALKEKVKLDDIIILRRGYQVIGIGTVAGGGYVYDSTYDDVYGWDLQHTQRVVWHSELADTLSELQVSADLFSGYKQISTFTQVKDRNVLDRVVHLFPQRINRPLNDLPATIPEPLTLTEFGEALFSVGLANDAVEHVLRAIERQRRLLRWYKDYGEASRRPDEHEVVSHMVLPLLLALGWSEQLLAVEWHKVDLAGFRSTPSNANACALVCEAKGVTHGLNGVLEQAIRYVNKLHLNECSKILVTQGGRFYLHQRNADGGWQEKPSGYINVEKIRTNHIVPSGTNAVKTLMMLTPGA